MTWFRVLYQVPVQVPILTAFQNFSVVPYRYMNQYRVPVPGTQYFTSIRNETGRPRRAAPKGLKGGHWQTVSMQVTSRSSCLKMKTCLKAIDCRLYAACMQPSAVQTVCRHLHADCSFRLHFRLHCTRTACRHCSCTAYSSDCSRPGSTAAQPWLFLPLGVVGGGMGRRISWPRFGPGWSV